MGEDVVVAASASIGIATAASESTWSSQLSSADIALYHAKTGPGDVIVFRDGMRHPTDS